MARTFRPQLLPKAIFLLCALWGLAVAPARAQEIAPVSLDLNIPTLTLVVREGDRVLRTYPVAVGMIGHETIQGDFTIRTGAWNPSWRPPAREWAKDDKLTPPGPKNPMGRIKLFFEPLYFIHGTPEEGSMGSAASHGCVRMRNADVIKLARLLHERASATVAPAQIDKILANSGKTRHVQFRKPIPLSIHYTPVVVEDGTLRIYPDVYGRDAIHTEGVYQALLAAGHSVEGVQRSEIAALLQRARKNKGTFSVPVEEVLRVQVAKR